MLFVGSIQAEPVEKKWKEDPIYFTDANLSNEKIHFDSLVITMDMKGTNVECILVDTESSVNILYKEIFEQLGIDPQGMKSNRTPLLGFTGDKMEAKEIVELKTEFMVIDISCVHNTILGRLSIAKTKAIISMTHLSMKSSLRTESELLEATKSLLGSTI